MVAPVRAEFGTTAATKTPLTCVCNVAMIPPVAAIAPLLNGSVMAIDDLGVLVVPAIVATPERVKCALPCTSSAVPAPLPTACTAVPPAPCASPRTATPPIPLLRPATPKPPLVFSPYTPLAVAEEQ